MSDSLKTQDKLPLEYATDEQLWGEMKRRMIGAVLVCDDPRRPVLHRTGVRLHGSLAHGIGLLNAGIEILDGVHTSAACNCEACRALRDQGGQEARD